MNHRIMILFLLAFCVTCGNNPSNESAGKCGSPSIHSCSGDPCSYIHIFDEHGNLVNEGTTSTGSNLQVYWNGLDCAGNTVPCGKYTIKQYVSSYGRAVTHTNEFLVAGDNSHAAFGRASCDSLKSVCTGSYVEATGSGFDNSGNITNDVQCLCCE